MRIEGGALPHWDGTPFCGAKAALIRGGDLLVLRRDDLPEIAWPNAIDLPGGGRENDENPIDCVRREIQEEVGLDLSPERFHWAKRHVTERSRRATWFLSAELSASEAAAVRLGDEGQACWLMPVNHFATHPKAVTHLRARVGDLPPEILKQNTRHLNHLTLPEVQDFNTLGDD